ncbi:enoyl-ACP reductase FabI [Flagellimonas allohymeniacidonis]|uniref:SDR family oxidoreductase n=1 Tax=Flagellimonas allohymeniacidonis TaxID=2517819 RepID=A0A4Q8QK26_9FLAO|nr:SDR family oxidoreductase [Allomuricauda hymeniacidonis]TAI48859.1 SDR family oxidoreductase [Allomuricauda hymeniacidonis]
MVNTGTSGKWALILGGSSGLGLATAKKLARHQFNLIIIHRDRKIDLEEINKDFQEITLDENQLHSFNIDATNKQKTEEVLQEIVKLLGPDKIDVLVHSIAKGNLKTMLTSTNQLVNEDFQLTINAMATSLYDWARSLVNLGLFAKDARIVSFTSEGSSKAWPGYAAVSAAKATLEAITRNIALEFAPLGVKANCIQAGTTDTKSFRMIPNSEILGKKALERNPNNRLTKPEDVADVVYLLTLEEAKWITGTVIKVDGGESIQ